MEYRFADRNDLGLLVSRDHWISEEMLKKAVEQERVLIAEEDGVFAGWLRYGLFWDEIPFMNMLRLREESRGKGFGREFVLFWEDLMKKKEFKQVMTSTSSAEEAQHFYRRLGYHEVGGFLPAGEPFELIFRKALD